MSSCLQGEGGGGHMRGESVEQEKHNRGTQLCNKPTIRHHLSTELQSTSVNMTAL